MSKTHKFILAAYILCGVITFGHAWKRGESRFKPTDDPSGQVCAAGFVSIAWPLYWSVVAWEK